MPELFPPTLADQQREIERELALRRRVYPEWVLRGRMTQAESNRRTASLEAALETIKTALHR